MLKGPDYFDNDELYLPDFLFRSPSSVLPDTFSLREKEP